MNINVTAAYESEHATMSYSYNLIERQMNFQIMKYILFILYGIGAALKINHVKSNPKVDYRELMESVLHGGVGRRRERKWAVFLMLYHRLGLFATGMCSFFYGHCYQYLRLFH